MNPVMPPGFQEGLRALLDLHTPSLSEENANEIMGRMTDGMVNTPDGVEVADLAIRTCRCGVMVDGFYSYIEHLKKVANG